MSKLRRIFESTPEISFISSQKEFSLYWNKFLESELGKIYQSIPWVELCKSLKIRNNHKGRTSLFTPQGKLALMFLKSYTCFSDKKLIENLNGNLHYQLFCGVFLGLEKLVDFKIISRIRIQISAKLDIPASQGILANAWKLYIDHPNVLLEDATCYESYIRYPTNVKLLWESVEWMYRQMKLTCKYLKIRTPRTRYLEQKDRYLSYSRKKRKSHKQTRVRIRSLLYLLDKLIALQDEIEKQYERKIIFPKRYHIRRKVIKQVLSQQQEMFILEKTSVPDRIVSIDKSYIRPYSTWQGGKES